MNLIRQTGSQMDRIVKCPASAALPQIIESEPIDGDPDRDPRTKGTVLHAFLADAHARGRELALDDVPALYRSACAQLALASIPDHTTMSHELALAYAPLTHRTRILTPVAHRAYEIDPETEIPLTLDVVGVSRERHWGYVGDYKGPHDWLPAPQDSYQLGLGAVALAALYGLDGITVEFVRLLDDGTMRRFGGELDTFALIDAQAKIRHAFAAVAYARTQVAFGLVPDVVAGRWCQRCPSRSQCPATTAAIRGVLSTDPATYERAITPENARDVYLQMQAAKRALAVLESGLYAYAATTPIPIEQTPDGDRYFGRLVREGNEVLDGPIVHRVLTETYGGELANQAVTMKTSKKAISETIRPVVEPSGDKITHAMTDVLARVRALGGASRPMTSSTIEYVVQAGTAPRAVKRR